MPAPVRVHLPEALIALFPAAPAELLLPAATLAELIAGLDRRFPGMRDRLSDSSPGIRRHINVFVDGRRIPLETRLEPGAEVFVMTAISGG